MYNTIENVFAKHRDIVEHKLGVSFDLFKNVIEAYTGTQFIGMNQRLRSKWGYMLNTYKKIHNIGDMKLLDSLIEHYNETLLNTFNTMPPFVSKEHLVLYRQINDANAKKLIKDGHLLDKGFTSATIDLMVSINHTHNSIENIEGMQPGRTFRLHLLPNVEYKLIAIDKYSAVPEEKEILFGPGLKYYTWDQSNDRHTLKLDSRYYTWNKTNDKHKVNLYTYPIYDCICVPNEPRYTHLFEKQNWLERWREMIMKENRFLFDTEHIQTYYEDEEDNNFLKLITSVVFINEMNYLIHSHISKLKIYANNMVFENLKDEMNVLIKELEEKEKYSDVVKFISIYIERVKKLDIYQGFMFKMYEDWVAAITTSLHKSGGAAEVLQDLEALLQDLSPMAPISGGVKNELRKTRQLLKQ